MISVYEELVDVARRAQSAAYAAYSGFKVGAALRTKSGQIFAGANVENISLGLTMCAERVCIGAAVASGDRQFDELVIVTEAREPTVPCGACRQVIAEFAPNLKITSATTSGEKQQFTMSELLPVPSQGINVPRRT